MSEMLPFPDKYKKELELLGKRYGILTPGTSFIVLESVEQVCRACAVLFDWSLGLRKFVKVGKTNTKYCALPLMKAFVFECLENKHISTDYTIFLYRVTFVILLALLTEVIFLEAFKVRHHFRGMFTPLTSCPVLTRCDIYLGHY